MIRVAKRRNLMGKQSKRVMSTKLMKENQFLFSCPLCKSVMNVNDDGNVYCNNNHSFNVAKQGYVNFMTKEIRSMYSKTLFESRKEIIQSGLYHPVQERLAQLIGTSANTILDTGCGEGSHLHTICQLLKQQVIAIGIDIAKEGIMTAAKYYEQKIWCVGDLSNSPFQEKSFDIVLNILSPANYEEFRRILKPTGKLIKVVPQSDYLKQLRHLAFQHSEKENYSNEQTVERFTEYFPKYTKQRVTYTVPLQEQLLPKLLEMTPLGWHINPELLEGYTINEITIDLDILVAEL